MKSNICILSKNFDFRKLRDFYNFLIALRDVTFMSIFAAHSIWIDWKEYKELTQFWASLYGFVSVVLPLVIIEKNIKKMLERKHKYVNWFRFCWSCKLKLKIQSTISFHFTHQNQVNFFFSCQFEFYTNEFSLILVHFVQNW